MQHVKGLSVKYKIIAEIDHYWMIKLLVPWFIHQTELLQFVIVWIAHETWWQTTMSIKLCSMCHFSGKEASPYRPDLATLHWLPIPLLIDSKMFLMAFKALHGLALNFEDLSSCIVMKYMYPTFYDLIDKLFWRFQEPNWSTMGQGLCQGSTHAVELATPASPTDLRPQWL